MEWKEPYVQVMQRKTSLSQEQGLAGSNPALHTIYTSDATGRHLRLRTGVLRVRVPPCVPVWCLRPDSNREPAPYESDAPPIELRRQEELSAGIEPATYALREHRSAC